MSCLGPWGTANHAPSPQKTFFIRWYFWGGVGGNCRNLRKRQHTHHPQFCTRDVDRQFLGVVRGFPALRAIFLSERLRGISKQFRVRSLQPLVLKCRMGVRGSTPGIRSAKKILAMKNLVRNKHRSPCDIQHIHSLEGQPGFLTFGAKPSTKK